MYITQETDYAIRIVYCLAKSGVRRDARSISEEMCISLRFALKILGKLAQGGLVSSFKGNRGGYELARSAKDISLKDVIDVVEGPWRMTRCADDASACNRSAMHPLPGRGCGLRSARGCANRNVRLFAQGGKDGTRAEKH